MTQALPAPQLRFSGPGCCRRWNRGRPGSKQSRDHPAGTDTQQHCRLRLQEEKRGFIFMSENKNNRGKKSYQDRRKRWLGITALTIAVIFLVWTIAASLLSVWASDDEEEEAMKGVWVATAYSLDYPSSATTDPAVLMQEADEILDNIRAMNLNTVFLQVRPFGDAFYDSDIFPWSRYLTGTEGTAPAGGFDPLAYWVSGAHARGLSIHAWINPYRIAASAAQWAAASPENPAKGSYSDCVVSCNGGYYYDPGNPRSIELIVKGVEEILAGYDVDGIQMDDYFYPSTSFNDDASWAAYGAGFSSRDDWRRDNVNRLVAQLYKTVHKAGKDLKFGISPFGIWGNAATTPGGSNTKGKESYSQSYADSLAWIKAGTVDYIAPQLYWNIGYSIADYKVLAEWWNNAVKGSDVDLYIGMGDYRTVDVTDSSSVWYGSGELGRQLALNRTLSEVKGEIHYQYNSLIKNDALKQLYIREYSSGGADEPQPAPEPSPAPEPEAPEDPNLIKIVVNGEKVVYQYGEPFIDGNGRTLCPMRTVGEALGLDVAWVPDTKNYRGGDAVFTGSGLKVVFTIDSAKYTVNGAAKTMDTAAIIRDSRTYAPVRYLAEAAGYDVSWDNDTRTVILEKK